MRRSSFTRSRQIAEPERVPVIKQFKRSNHFMPQNQEQLKGGGVLAGQRSDPPAGAAAPPYAGADIETHRAAAG